MKKKLFIGRLNHGLIEGSDGVVIKNRVVLHRLSEFNSIDVFDLDNIRNKSLSKILSMICLVARQTLFGGGIIIGSGGSDKSCKLLKIIRTVTFGKPLWIVGLGGNMHEYVCSNKANIDIMKHAKAILAEGKFMTKTMREAGLLNTYYIPNCKEITYIPQKGDRTGNVVNFVFFARVNKFKGCNDIMEAVKILNERGLTDCFTVSFYGYKAPGYEVEFDKQVALYKNVSYMGARDAHKKETFDELSKYDVMLFPTYWGEEGFPATIVDASIAGLPVIASDWKCNGEIIVNGVNGFLIPIKSPSAIAEKMGWFINHQDSISQMSRIMQAHAMDYDTRHVLSDSFLKEIGLIK